jgi:cathepsin F
VKVLVQAWQKRNTLESFACNDKPSVAKTKNENTVHMVNKVPMPGAPVETDTEQEGIKEVLDFSIEELNSRSDSALRAVLTKVAHVTSQVVAGIKYKIEIHLGMTDCKNTPKNKHATLEQCPPKQDDHVEKCNLVVLDVAWQTPRYSLLDFSCKLVPNPELLTFTAKSSTGLGKTETGKPMLGGDGHDFAHWGVFQEFKKKYGKTYSDSAEEKKRFGIFRENMKKAKKLQESELGTARYGATEFADMSEEEFRKYYRNPEWDTSYDPSLKQADIPSDPAPDAFDWRDHGAVTPVKNQGMCGSCWAFSTTGNIEGQWAIKRGNLVSLSEQELVSCDKLDDGCEGGLPTNAYKEIIRLGGLEPEKQYPYDGRDEKCTFDLGDVKVYINGSVNISKNEDDMAVWLAKNGPISIGINANAMQFYFGGVSHPWKIFCNPSSLDHGVLIVGYGTKKGFFSTSPYWIVKNSWGGSWGEKGYYLVYRGDGVCGLNQMCTSAVVG